MKAFAILVVASALAAGCSSGGKRVTAADFEVKEKSTVIASRQEAFAFCTREATDYWANMREEGDKAPLLSMVSPDRLRDRRVSTCMETFGYTDGKQREFNWQ